MNVAAQLIRHRWALLVLALILLDPLPEGRPLPTVFAAQGGTEQGSENIPFLVSGRAVGRELSSGEAHSYYITLYAGQYLRVVVEQQSIDAGVTLFGPDGRVLARVNCRQYGPSPVSLIADSDGRYRLEVRAAESAHAHGLYDLKVEEIRSATPQDNQRVIAEQTVAEGEQLLKEWKAESSRRAIDKLKDSLSLWRAIGDRREEARTLRRIGDIYQPFCEYQNALTVYRQALLLDRETKDRWGESETLNQISYVYISLGENQKALEQCTKALKSSQETGNRRGEAAALNNIGEVNNWSGDLQRALEFYRRALSIWRAIGDRRGQAQTYTYLGYTYSDLGQVNEALDAYNQALSFWQAASDRRGQALTFGAFGRFYSRVGERQMALDFFFRAMQLSQEIGDPIEEARTCSGIAYVYNDLGEQRRALEYYDRALSLFRSANYPNGEAGILNDYAGVYLSLGDYQKALAYLQQSVSIFRSTGNHRMEIVGLRDMGRIFDAQGDKTMALKTYLRARSFYHSEKGLRGEAITLNLIGDIYQGRGEMRKALDYYTKALPLCRQAEYRLGEAATLYNIARVERNRLNLAAARAGIEAALEIVEALRVKVTSQDLRASYFSSVRQHYELYVDILMKLHQQHPTEALNTAAFNMSEKARARSLLESLNEARADIKQGVDPALLERERSLEQTLNAKAERHAQLVAGKSSDEEQAVAHEIDRLTSEYDEVRTQIRSKSPRYAALTQPQPLSLNEIQQTVLDDNSLLLEYMLGDDRSYVWAVTRTEVWSFELPGRAHIEEAALRFHKLLTANQPVQGETFEQRQARVVEANMHIAEEAALFSKLVLGPVADKLGTKRLLIVPDGALQYIPFQALTVPTTTNAATEQARTAGNADEQIPLFVDHEIVNEPSASTLALVMSDKAGRQPAPNSVVVFANPVFEADDPRVKSNSSSATPVARLSQETQVQEAFRDVGFGEGKQIPPLPASHEEADAIMSVVPWRSGLRAEGFEASRATITGPVLSQYRIVHFATHGFVDYQHPELSGLVLSLVDEKGNPQDGFLRMHDIYNLKLPVDLVVLSACNTGLGKDVRGEGLMGLTRGFMYAGAGGVVASLWKVDDDATAELMKHFYEGMFKRGLSPAAALREAQLTMWRQKRWHAPYYWAAFVIQGQYDQKEMPSRRPTASQIATLAAVISALSVIAFLFLRRRRTKILQVQ